MFDERKICLEFTILAQVIHLHLWCECFQKNARHLEIQIMNYNTFYQMISANLNGFCQM